MIKLGDFHNKLWLNVTYDQWEARCLSEITPTQLILDKTKLKFWPVLLRAASVTFF